MATAVTAKDNDKSTFANNSLDTSHLNQNKSAIEGDGNENKLFSQDFHEEELMKHITYETLQKSLDDPALYKEPMYIKLRERIETFFIKQERDRKLSNPAKSDSKSEISLDYSVELFKSLRQMMLHIINLKEMHMKKTQLRQVYEWFFQRLKAIGALSKQEIEEEFKFLNPDHG